MKRIAWMLLVLVAAMLTLATAAVAQGRIYNVTTEQTVTGTIQQVDRIQPPEARGPWGGIHLSLKQDGTEPLEVHLGPSWFLDNQESKLAVGDVVTILGSRVTLDGKPVLIARTVTRGDETLVLRDERGFPMWAGWRRNQKL